MKLWCRPALAFLALAGASATAAPAPAPEPAVVISPGPDQVAVTVYRDPNRDNDEPDDYEPIDAEAGIVGRFGYFFNVSLNWFTMLVMYPYDHPLSEPE